MNLLVLGIFTFVSESYHLRVEGQESDAPANQKGIQMQIKTDRSIFSELEAYADRVYPSPQKNLADPNDMIMAATQRALNGKLWQKTKSGHNEEVVSVSVLPTARRLKKTGNTKVKAK